MAKPTASERGTKSDGDTPRMGPMRGLLVGAYLVVRSSRYRLPIPPQSVEAMFVRKRRRGRSRSRVVVVRRGVSAVVQSRNPL